MEFHQASVSRLAIGVQQEAHGYREQDQGHEQAIDGCRERSQGDHAAYEHPGHACQWDQAKNERKHENHSYLRFFSFLLPAVESDSFDSLQNL